MTIKQPDSYSPRKILSICIPVLEQQSFILQNLIKAMWKFENTRITCFESGYEIAGAELC